MPVLLQEVYCIGYPEADSYPGIAAPHPGASIEVPAIHQDDNRVNHGSRGSCTGWPRAAGRGHNPLHACSG
jgi:hypothetical protein